MPGLRRLAGKGQVQLPALYYISGETVATPNNVALTVPSTATIVWIASEDGDCYYTINGAIAGTTSPGHIATDDRDKIGPIANLTGIRVHGPAATVHVQYWREA